MRSKMLTLAIATSFMLTLSGAAMAQTAAGGGKAEGDMNNPGSVKSNSEKGMERTTGSTTGSTMAPADGKMAPASGMKPNSSGDGGGNAATGSGAAPSGK